MKLLDITIILATVTIITLYVFDTISMSNNSKYLKVEVEGKEFLYDINTDLTKTFTGPIGETTVQILGGKAAIIASDCTNKICIRMGHISKGGQSAACLPNRVLITIEGDRESEVDAATY